jgi:hypothetical protein
VPGAKLPANADLPFYAALVVEGRMAIADETLGTWDFIRVAGTSAHDAIVFPDGATLLAATLS